MKKQFWMQNRKWFGYDVLTIIIGSCKTVETHYFLSQSVSQSVNTYACMIVMTVPTGLNAIMQGGRNVCLCIIGAGVCCVKYDGFMSVYKCKTSVQPAGKVGCVDLEADRQYGHVLSLSH